MIRELTDDEHAKFDHWGAHTNMGGTTACCPHCAETVELNDPVTEDAQAIACLKCGKEFAVWQEMVSHVHSGKLP